MDSPMGLRGVICERFGWTYDYLLDGIPWMDVHTMMKDAPMYVPDKPKPTGHPVAAGAPVPGIPEAPTEPKTNGEKLNSFLSKFL